VTSRGIFHYMNGAAFGYFYRKPACRRVGLKISQTAFRFPTQSSPNFAVRPQHKSRLTAACCDATAWLSELVSQRDYIQQSIENLSQYVQV